MGGDGDYIPREGYIVTFSGDESVTDIFFRVLRREGFTYTTGDTSGTAEFSTVAANAATGFKDIKVLEPDSRPQRAAYVQVGFKDALQYALKLKSGTIRFGPDKDKNSAKLFNWRSPYFSSDPVYDFWLLGPDYFPSMQATNVTPFTVTPTVFFKGYKFDLQQLNQAEGLRLKEGGRYEILTLGGIVT